MLVIVCLLFCDVYERKIVVNVLHQFMCSYNWSLERAAITFINFQYRISLVIRRSFYYAPEGTSVAY